MTIWDIEQMLDDVIDMIDEEMSTGPMSHDMKVMLWDEKDRLQAIYNRAGA
jgi:hypothetical protein